MAAQCIPPPLNSVFAGLHARLKAEQIREKQRREFVVRAKAQAKLRRAQANARKNTAPIISRPTPTASFTNTERVGFSFDDDLDTGSSSDSDTDDYRYEPGRSKSPIVPAVSAGRARTRLNHHPRASRSRTPPVRGKEGRREDRPSSKKRGRGDSPSADGLCTPTKDESASKVWGDVSTELRDGRFSIMVPIRTPAPPVRPPTPKIEVMNSPVAVNTGPSRTAGDPRSEDEILREARADALRIAKARHRAKQRARAREFEKTLVQARPMPDLVTPLVERFKMRDRSLVKMVTELSTQQSAKLVSLAKDISARLQKACAVQDRGLKQWKAHWEMERRYVEARAEYPFTRGGGGPRPGVATRPAIKRTGREQSLRDRLQRLRNAAEKKAETKTEDLGPARKTAPQRTPAPALAAGVAPAPGGLMPPGAAGLDALVPPPAMTRSISVLPSRPTVPIPPALVQPSAPSPTPFTRPTPATTTPPISAPPPQTAPTGSSSFDGAAELAKMKTTLEKAEKAMADYKKANRAGFQQASIKVKRMLSQLTNSAQDIIAKNTALDDLRKESDDPTRVDFVNALIAKQIVQKARGAVKKESSHAFKFAYIIIAQSSKNPMMMKYVLAFLCELSPLLVPCVQRQEDYQTLDEFWTASGLKEVDEFAPPPEDDVPVRGEAKTFETRSQFTLRAKGCMTIFAAILQSPPPPGSEHPLDIYHGWRWLTRTLNREPQLGTATVLAGFLKIAGYAMQQSYPNQFPKLMRFMKEDYLGRFKRGDDAAEAEHFERMALMNALETAAKGFEPPKGSKISWKKATVQSQDVIDSFQA